MEKKMVVIGAGSAGASACFAARKYSRDVEIVCIDDEVHPTYSRCALPFVISGEIEDFDTPTVFDFEFFRKQRVDIWPGTKVLSVDVGRRLVRTPIEEVEYDALVLATGGRAKVPDMPGAGLPGVMVLRTRNDGEAIVKEAQKGKGAVVNGASFIALEVAEALRHRGMETKLVIRSRALRSMIDAPLSKVVEEKLEEKGIGVLKGDAVNAVLGEEKVTGVKVGDAEVQADMVVMCTGTAPEVELARSMGVTIGQTGGISVNERLETNFKGVFAAGDCVESECFIR
ncbi:MAG: FAD-dependent oxidoreductase, partial [Thermoplasmata archaeon]|nr:FAD-dependent oxidoreductase [Thermoplasmata archaeon]